jgi:hypothetical protein
MNRMGLEFGFSLADVDRLGSGEFLQRRVFMCNSLNVRPLAA